MDRRSGAPGGDGLDAVNRTVRVDQKTMNAAVHAELVNLFMDSLVSLSTQE